MKKTVLAMAIGFIPAMASAAPFSPPTVGNYGAPSYYGQQQADAQSYPMGSYGAPQAVNPSPGMGYSGYPQQQQQPPAYGGGRPIVISRPGDGRTSDGNNVYGIPQQQQPAMSQASSSYGYGQQQQQQQQQTPSYTTVTPNAQITYEGGGQTINENGFVVTYLPPSGANVNASPPQMVNAPNMNPMGAGGQSPQFVMPAPPRIYGQPANPVNHTASKPTSKPKAKPSQTVLQQPAGYGQRPPMMANNPYAPPPNAYARQPMMAPQGYPQQQRSPYPPIPQIPGYGSPVVMQGNNPYAPAPSYAPQQMYPNQNTAGYGQPSQQNVPDYDKPEFVPGEGFVADGSL
jgi:hypothetical protein